MASSTLTFHLCSSYFQLASGHSYILLKMQILNPIFAHLDSIGPLSFYYLQ